MSVTYTTAAERDTHRLWRDARRGWPEPLLAVTSCVAALAIVLACIGRLRAFDESEVGGAGARVVNLNTVRDAAVLEPALGAAFANANDRRFAAVELFRFLNGEGSERRSLPNVGAVSRAMVSTAAVRDARHLQAFAERVRPAQGARVALPESIPLFTSADISKLKPFLIVRTRDEFQRQAWLFAALYVLGFHAVALLWQRRRIRTDLLLLATAHLLTAIGFAVLLSRPDPLRDSLLFVRYAETIVLGLAIMAALSYVDVAAMGFVSLSYLPLIAALSLSVLLIFFGSGPGQQLGQGQSRPAATDRGHPSAPRFVPRRILCAAMGAAEGRPERSHSRRARAGVDQSAPNRVRPSRACRRRRRAHVLLLPEGPRPRPLSLLRLPGRVRGRARTSRHGRHGIGPPGIRLLSGSSASNLVDARRPRAHVAIAVGQRGRRRESGHARHLGHGHWRRLRHRPWPWRLAVSASRPHRPDTRGRRRGARCDRACRGRGALRRPRVAGLPHRPACRERLRILSGHGSDALLDLPRADHGVRCHGSHAADGCRHAVPELRRLGHAGKLRGTGPARGDPRRPPSRE